MAPWAFRGLVDFNPGAAREPGCAVDDPYPPGGCVVPVAVGDAFGVAPVPSCPISAQGMLPPRRQDGYRCGDAQHTEAE